MTCSECSISSKIPYPRGETWAFKLKFVLSSISSAGITSLMTARRSLLDRKNPGTSLQYAGKVGTGFTESSARELRHRLDALGRTESPFGAGTGIPRAAHWVEPRLVAQVRFTEWTRDGRLRHPSFEGLREDKDARDVRREQALPGAPRRGKKPVSGVRS